MGNEEKRNKNADKKEVYYVKASYVRMRKENRKRMINRKNIMSRLPMCIILVPL